MKEAPSGAILAACGAEGNRTGVLDFGVPLADGSWMLGSGLAVADESGQVIAAPTYHDILTHGFEDTVTLFILEVARLDYLERWNEILTW